MKIDFKHLGGIDEGSIELNDFTLFCGKNNSGKTYVMYSIYGLLDKEFDIHFGFVKEIIDNLKENGTVHLEVENILSQHREEMIRYIEKHFKAYLPRLFCVPEDEFSDTAIYLNFDNEDLLARAIKKPAKRLLSLGKSKDWSLSLEKEADNGAIQLTLHNTEIPDSLLQDFISKALVSIIFTCLSKDSFLLPAERAGLNLFFKELSSTRNILLQHAQKDKVNLGDLLKDIVNSSYADPVQDYIQYLNKIGRSQKQKSIYHEFSKNIQKKILNGKYDVDGQGNVFFLPYRSNNKKLPLHFSSSTVKTLFGLVFYLEHLAEEGDCLMIDEPELNLHPDNQRQVARVLAQLVNAGLKIIVSTHSDYFIRELNNLIMLKTCFSGATELQNKYGYQDNELLAANQVSAYLFDNKKIVSMRLDLEEGIIAETFDDVINDLNKSSNEIYYAMQDAKELND
ncbi:MAG: AAA family ATPase [Methylococcaceae bacterium]|nr:AAA family ATPase [Methylococcaceae bacterium]MDP3902381.1 AAA family ATPase [Methylococcaceae bacterium]